MKEEIRKILSKANVLGYKDENDLIYALEKIEALIEREAVNFANYTAENYIHNGVVNGMWEDITVEKMHTTSELFKLYIKDGK